MGMYDRRHDRPHVSFGVIAMLVLIAVAAAIASGADQKVSWRFTDPDDKSPTQDPYDADDNPDGWRNDTNNTGPVTIQPGGCVYFGMTNAEKTGYTKSVWLDLNWFGYNPKDTFKTSSFGYYQGNKVKAHISSVGHNKKIRVSWQNCPAWEYIKLTNVDDMAQTVTIRPILKQTKCTKPSKRTADGSPGPDDTFEILDGTFGVPGQMLTPMRITALEIYPERQAPDPGGAAVMAAPPSSGVWSASFTPIDPLGAVRPGVRFATDGPGLMLEDAYDLHFSMIDGADTRYTLFALDADSGDWTDYIIDLRVTPWYEDFEIYGNAEPLDGSSGWAGWDADPAFGATTSAAESRSPPHSVEIKDNTDLVRSFGDADGGHWRFEAWQYIPSDFATGSSGQFAGSYLNMLNTYEPGQPHDPEHWSVQIQFDPTDGMCKVFHGDGLNTINVPYETDRWVKIQAEINLAEDWTQVFYDDFLVAEYCWIGGVTGDESGGGSGEEGGARAIAIVDLYAQDSTSIYYDDLSLVPVIEVCVADLAEPFGELNFFDVVAFIAAFNAMDPAADLAEPFGAFNFFDVAEYIGLFNAGCP